MMKMTKKEMFATLIAVVEGKMPLDLLPQEDIDFLVDKMNHEVELLDKKATSGSKGQTKVQKENEVLKDQLVMFLTEQGKAMRVCEIIADEKFPYSSSKISRLLNDMAKEGRVIRTEVKRVAYFGV